MKKFCSFILLSVLVSWSTNTLAARSLDPCDSSSNLKGWAKKLLTANCSTTDGSSTTPDNSVPSISITSPTDGTSVEEGTALQFKASATDAEDGDLSSKVSWKSSLNGSIGSLATLAVGNHLITASVTDSAGATVTDEIYITITAAPVVNTTPSLSITGPSNGTSVEQGTALQFKASATDAEDGDLSSKVRWKSSLDGSISSLATLSTGNHLITASVTDSAGATVTDTIQVTVTPAPVVNSVPTISITSPTDGTSVEEGTTLQFKASANDAEDGDLSGKVRWTSSLDGSIGNLVTLSPGNHLITASVTDSAGATVTDEIFITVTAAPVVTTHSVSLSWSAPLARTDGTVLTLDELAGYLINWKNQTTGSSGSVKVDGAANTLYQLENLESGSYSFTLNSLDTSGLVSAASAPIVVDLN